MEATKEFIAHKAIDKKTNTLRTETVQAHCERVADYASAKAAPYGLRVLLYTAGLLHDIGKCCDEFQTYIKDEDSVRGSVKHAYAGAWYILHIAELELKTVPLTGVVKERIQNTATLIAHIILQHHGLVDWITRDGVLQLSASVNRAGAPLSEIKENIQNFAPVAKVRQYLHDACAEYNVYFNRIASMPLPKNPVVAEQRVERSFYFGMLERFALSFLIDADWSCTSEFQYGRPAAASIDRAQIWELTEQTVEKQYAIWAQNDKGIQGARNAYAQYCYMAARMQVEPRIRTLTIPTGGGKTLASLRYAVQYNRINNCDHIYYAAPYNSILEQNGEVWRRYVPSAAVLEHHTDVNSFKRAKQDVARYISQASQWSAPVIMTSWVQLLNTMFSASLSSVRRFHQLANSTFIFDEVQGIPVKCIYLFNLVVNFLNMFCKANIVLMSATQPDLNSGIYEMHKAPNAEIIPSGLDVSAFKRVSLYYKQGVYTCKQAAAFCVQQLQTNSSVLCVVNTKNAAATIFKEASKILPKDAYIVHLSTNMCAAHRMQTISLLRAVLSSGRRCFCISTQIIEAGVDISFQCVVRSTAGMDNAMQAAGRCNRNGEYGHSTAYMLTITDENTSYVPDIATAQKVTHCVLNTNDTKNKDLNQLYLVHDFFDRLFKERKGQFVYMLPEEGARASILELLSTNDKRYDLSKAKYWHQHFQAFKTAGTSFAVIVKEQTPVLVPYNEEAKEIIQALLTTDDLVTRAALIAAMQAYTIQLYPNQIDNLKDKALTRVKDMNLWVLNEAYYDTALGLITKPL